MADWTSNLWILHSDAPPLSQRDSMLSKTMYKVHMTCVLHAARISNVDSVMFVNRTGNPKVWGSILLGTQNFFYVPGRWWDRKTIFSLSFCILFLVMNYKQGPGRSIDRDIELNFFPSLSSHSVNKFIILWFETKCTSQYFVLALQKKNSSKENLISIVMDLRK